MANLTVDTIYLYAQENATIHKTDSFEMLRDENFSSSGAILRRGQKFTMAVRFENRAFRENEDQLRIIFNYGPLPNALKGTKGTILIKDIGTVSNDKNVWHGNVLAKGEDTLTIEVFIPASVPIGIWKIEIETSKINNRNPPNIYAHDGDVYILFNPWVCQDLVNHPEKRLLDEYILQDIGKIWVGPYGSSRGREWVFGQFHSCILPAIMLMLERSGLPHSSRGDPIKMSRMISKMVNSNDEDGGILIGNWSGDYSDGTAPSAWTGSVAILQEYLDTQQPVPYGQCWVFAGVVTTVCRALGIPSRVVSNLVSAHDANSSLSIDKYYDKNNDVIDGDPNNPYGEDSIWNYHVWNDVWMARPDLPPGYGGWQAIDATPQEPSSNFFQCGPAPVEAVKQGAVGYNFDVPFMVASVNADIMRWKEDPGHVLGFTKIYCNKYHVGRVILTKKPFLYDPNGDRDKEDITCIYKNKEGTEAERLSLFTAVRGSELAKKFFAMPDPELEDMEFELKDIEKIDIGKTFQAVVEIKNKSNDKRTISAQISAYSVYYTGLKANFIEKAKGDFVLLPHSERSLKMTVTPEKYLDKLVEYGMIKMNAAVTVAETRQTWADEDDFQLNKPSIKIQIPAEIQLGHSTRIAMTFRNPLNLALTECKFYLHGPAITKNYVLNYQNVKPNDQAIVETVITPTNLGEQVLVATFHSKELHDVSGSVKIQIYK